VLILAVILLLGLLPTSGRFTVIAGFLTAGLMTGYVGYAMTALASTGPASGSILVVAGGVIGAIGGLFPRRAKAPDPSMS
jgi:LPXTG-motif cell wall-anchored protein